MNKILKKLIEYYINKKQKCFLKVWYYKVEITKDIFVPQFSSFIMLLDEYFVKFLKLFQHIFYKIFVCKNTLEIIFTSDKNTKFLDNPNFFINDTETKS